MARMDLRVPSDNQALKVPRDHRGRRGPWVFKALKD